MGRVKALYLDSQEPGCFEESKKFVCSECVGDKALKKIIRKKSRSNKCDYCKVASKKTKAMRFNELMEIMYDAFLFEYCDANDLPYDSAEGGYQGEVYDGWDLSWHLEAEAGIESKDLLDDIKDALLNIQFCLPPQEFSEILSSAWEGFVELITGRYRYTFFNISEKLYPDSIYFSTVSPRKFLKNLASILGKCENMVKILPVNTEIIRVRFFGHQDEAEAKCNAKELGSPPKECSVSNRMSPAGIPFFYGALCKETALKETNKENTQKYAVVARFSTLKEIVILDLSELPQEPSLFDKKKRALRQGIRFLKKFSEEISRSITRDGREHEEYVPTQVMAEYFRHIYKWKRRTMLDGIFYPSSKESGGVCCALFVENEQCIDSEDHCTAQSFLLLKGTSVELV